MELRNCDCQYWERVRGSHPGRHFPAHFVATKSAGVFWRYCCITVIAQNIKGKEIQLALQKIGRVFCDGHSSCGNLCFSLRLAPTTLESWTGRTCPHCGRLHYDRCHSCLVLGTSQSFKWSLFAFIQGKKTLDIWKIKTVVLNLLQCSMNS